MSEDRIPYDADAGPTSAANVADSDAWEMTRVADLQSAHDVTLDLLADLVDDTCRGYVQLGSFITDTRSQANAVRHLAAHGRVVIDAESGDVIRATWIARP